MPDQNPTSNITGITIDPNSVQPLQSAPPEDLSHVSIDPSSVTALPQAAPPAATQEPPTPAFSLSKMLGQQTAIGSQPTESEQQEMSGVSDFLHGNFRQGVGKIMHAETPHVIPGSPIEKLIQKFKPDFHGDATPEYQQANEPAINKPLVNTSQFIDKKQHPVQKAIAEISESMLSPGAIATIVGSGGFGLVENPAALSMMNRFISAGFAAPSIVSLYQHSKSFADSYNKRDWTEAAYQATHALASGVMSALTTTGAAGGTDAVAAKTTELAGKAAEIPGKVVSAGKAVLTPVDTLADYISKGNQEFNVPLSRGQAGGKLAGAVESGLKKIPLVNRPFQRLNEVQATALNTAADNIVNRELAPGTESLSPSERGQNIQDSLEDAKKVAGKGYENALQELAKTDMASVPLDMSGLREIAKKSIADLQPVEGFEALSGQGRNRAIQILSSIANADPAEPLTVGEAIKLRTQLGEEVNTGEMRPHKAVLGKMRQAISDEIFDTSISTIGNLSDIDAQLDKTDTQYAALDNFKAASDRYRDVSSALKNGVIKRALRVDPQSVGTLLLDKMSPEVSDHLHTLSSGNLKLVGDGMLQAMFDKVKDKNGDVLAGEDLAKIWNGLDDDAKSVIFGDNEQRIDRFVELAKKIDLQKPKSGWSASKITGAGVVGAAAVETGVALAAHGIPVVTGPAVAGAFTGYELSKILTGRGGQSFLEAMKDRANATTPEEIQAATERLQNMQKTVRPKVKDQK